MTTLRPIAEGVWGHEEIFTVASGFQMPARATLVRQDDGSLLVHSPLAIDDALASEIAAHGEVRHIVAPNCMHWLHVAAALARYPAARVYGPEGLEKKLTAKTGIEFEPLPARGALGSLAVERIDGASSVNEHVFFHARSRTLVATDLMFNVCGGESALMGLVLRAVGAYHKTAQSRLWRFTVKDRVAAARSAARVLEWDFARVVVAHGDVIVDSARERTQAALSWMCSADAAALSAA